MNKKQIAELLTTIPNELLLPIERVVTITIADTYKELSTVPMGELNSLIDIERASRNLPIIPWKEHTKQSFLADMAELNKRSKNGN